MREFTREEIVKALEWAEKDVPIYPGGPTSKVFSRELQKMDNLLTLLYEAVKKQESSAIIDALRIADYYFSTGVNLLEEDDIEDDLLDDFEDLPEEDSYNVIDESDDLDEIMDELFIQQSSETMEEP